MSKDVQVVNTWQNLPAFRALRQLPVVGKLYFIIWRSTSGELKAGIGTFQKNYRFGIKRIGGSVFVTNVRFCLPIEQPDDYINFRAKFSVGVIDKDRVWVQADRPMGAEQGFYKNGRLLNWLCRWNYPYDFRWNADYLLFVGIAED